MLNTLLSSLVTYFQTVVDTAYFEDGAPNSPDTCVYLVEYSGGSGDDFSSNRKVQINVRGLTNSDAKQTAWALYKSLNHGDGDSILEILGGRFLICSRLQPPFLLDRDAKNRTIYTFNISVCTPHDTF